MKPTPAQQRLIDAAARREDGRVVGGDPRARQALRARGWAEVYGRNYGPLDRLTTAGRALARPSKER